jgi:hypothetical protein
VQNSGRAAELSRLRNVMNTRFHDGPGMLITIPDVTSCLSAGKSATLGSLTVAELQSGSPDVLAYY